MEDLIRDILKKIRNYPSEQVELTPYCLNRIKERNVEETLVISTLFSKNSLYYAKEQLKPYKGKIEKRHKLIFKISSKYSLIIVIVFYPKVLKVVNVIKTSKGAEKQWRKKILK